MERRDFLQRSGVGLLGIAPAVAADAPSIRRHDIVNAADFGAIGDGKTDDTVALQKAIDTAVEQGKPCFIPSGAYRTTAPLVVGGRDMHQLTQGFHLFGTGKTPSPDGAKGGTAIVLTTASQRAVLIFARSAWRRCEISDVGLSCSEQDGAKYGLLFESTEFANHTVNNVGVYRTEVAFGIEVGTGGNGEFTLFNNCGGWNVRKFFYSNSGQAYVQYFHHCECYLLADGTYFHLDLPSGGGGVTVVDFNGSAEWRRDKVSNTTLVKNGNSDSCLNFYGGRVEALTQLYEYMGGTTNLHVTANFTGLQFSVDSDHVNPTLTKPDFVRISLAPDTVVIQSCKFQAVTDRETIEISASDSHAAILFQACQFYGFVRPPQINAQDTDLFSQIRFEDCTATAPTGESRGNRPYPLERRSHQRIGALGRRWAFSENGWAQSGRPVNLLVRPQFTTRSGKNIEAEAPWTHSGAAGRFDAHGWNDEAAHPQSASPWAKLIVLQPRSGLQQDIGAVDLAGPALPYNGEQLRVVTYQAMLARVAGNVSLRIALLDSVDGAIFDQTVLGDNGDTRLPRLVTLTAAVMRRTVSSHVRLAIENTSENPATVEFLWQFAADIDDAAFAPSDFAPVRSAEPWGLSSESGRFWHRLALPHKSDAFGRAAARPLEDLRSDVYLSSDSEKLNFFANGRWWTAPRAASAAGVPREGRWAQGDLVYNAAPVAGGALGWVQVTPGALATDVAWSAATAFAAGTRVHNGDAVYDCLAGGTSGDGEGPHGESTHIADGGCVWAYAGTLAAIACAHPWAPGDHAAGHETHHQGRVYRCLAAGRSAQGPTGTGHAIADGTALWRYLGKLAVFKRFGSIEG